MATKDDPFTGGLVVRQWTEEERERYMSLPPPPEIAAKERRKARRERRDAEMGVTQTGKRIEELIGKGVSPQQIHHDTLAHKSTILAAAERLGLVWINDAWESVAAQEPGEYPTDQRSRVDPNETLRTEDVPAVATDQRYEQSPGAPVPDSEKAHITPEAALRIAIDEGIDAGKPPMMIATEEHCDWAKVYARADERGLGYDISLARWVPLSTVLAGATVMPSARPETPQSAEGNVLPSMLGGARAFTPEEMAEMETVRPDAPVRWLTLDERDEKIRSKAWDAGYSAGRADEREQIAAFAAPKPHGDRPMLAKILRVLERVQTYEADVETEQWAREGADWAAEELSR